MIGFNDIPLQLKVDRLYTNALSEDRLSSWDEGDIYLQMLIDGLIETKEIESTVVSSFRSSRAEVSVLKSKGMWIVAFDERLFDYLYKQLCLFLSPNLDQLYDHLAGTLLRYVAELQVKSDPHFAIVLAQQQKLFLSGITKTFRTSYESYEEICTSYRIMRTFILAHELGHIGIKGASGEFMKRESFNRDQALTVIRDLINMSDLDQFYFGADRASFEQEVLSHPTNDDDIIADIFAMRTTIDLEILISESKYTGDTTEIKVLAIARTYDAIMLLYFIMSTMNIGRELFRPKSIRANTDILQFTSVKRQSIRADVRGHLFMLQANQILDGDVDLINRLSHNSPNLRKRYMETQFLAQSAFYRQFDRAVALQAADDIRDEISVKDAIRILKAEFGYEMQV